MNLLSQLIPAIREIRAPLLGGYLWLVNLWLIVEGDVPETPEPGTSLASLHRLETLVGAVGLAAAVSVLAYLVGSVIGEGIEQFLNWRVGQRREALESYASVAPDARYQIDRPLLVFAEADLRFHVALPAIASAATLDGWLRLIVPAGGLVIALHGFRLAQRARKYWAAYGTSIERTVADAVEDKADLSVRPFRQVSSSAPSLGIGTTERRRYGIEIFNNGPGTARRIDVVEFEREDSPPILDREVLPIPELRKGDSVVVNARVTIGNAPRHIEIALMWSDGAGSWGEPRTVTMDYG